MSLFSLVQGRIPPAKVQEQPNIPLQPPMQNQAMMAQPQLMAPQPPPQEIPAPMPTPMDGINGAIQGMMDGGGWNIPGFEPGVINFTPGDSDDVPLNLGPTPIYQNQIGGPTQGGAYGAQERYTGDPGQIGQYRLAYPKDEWMNETGGSASEYATFISSLVAKDAADTAYDRSRAGGSGPGPDHFYEEMAENARIFEAERADARAMADQAAQVAQEQARMDWHKTLADAETNRRSTITSAAGQSQDTFTKMLSQAQPGWTGYFNANALPDAVANTYAPEIEQPNIPGVVWK